MLRGFHLLLIGIIFSATTFSARAADGYVGLSSEMAHDGKTLVVTYVAPGSPAADAGIVTDDHITAIDGVPVAGFAPEAVEHGLAGEIGVPVRLDVLREGAPERQISVVRQSALNVFLPGAKSGEAVAEYRLGYFYEHGPLATRDLTQAASWFRRAADQDLAPAQVNLGYLYCEGEGVAKDEAAGCAWYAKAANQGDAVAERDLGTHCAAGTGVPRDDRAAFAWFYSAARQDDSPAEQRLANAYRKGFGTSRDNRAAFAWYYRSAEQHNSYGEWGLAYMYQHGLGTRKDVAQALKWYRAAQAQLPEDEQLKGAIAGAQVAAFLHDPGSTAIDLAPIMATSGLRFHLLLALFGVVYVAGFIVLCFFTFRTGRARVKLAVASGWLLFYIESQGLALLVLIVFGKSLTPDLLIGSMVVFGPVPILAASLGPIRKRLWKPFRLPWQRILLYGAASVVGVWLIGFLYAVIYMSIVHGQLPAQPTVAIIDKIKHASVWLAYATVALAMPATEELIFRGYLFDALRRRLSRKVVIAITALVFSIVHLQGLYFVPLFGFGLVLGWLRARTGSLYPAILLHVLNNAFSLFLMR